MRRLRALRSDREEGVPGIPVAAGWRADRRSLRRDLRRAARSAGRALLLCAPAAGAHPQHPGGSPLDAGLWHLLAEPDHLALLLAPLALAAGIRLWRRRVRAARGREHRREGR